MLVSPVLFEEDYGVNIGFAPPRFSRAFSSRRTPRLKRFGVLHIVYSLLGTTSVTDTVPMSATLVVSEGSGTICPATATV